MRDKNKPGVTTQRPRVRAVRKMRKRVRQKRAGLFLPGNQAPNKKQRPVAAFFYGAIKNNWF